MTALQEEQKLCDEASAALGVGDLHKAADLCKTLLLHFPQSARGYYLTSSLFRATGNYRKAHDYSAIAAGLDQCVVQYQMQQGEMLYILKHYEEAFEAFTRAAAIEHENPDIQRWLGKCLVALERFSDAKECFARARAEKSSSELIIAEAECDMQSGDADAAEKTLAQCIAAEPGNADAHYALALLSIASSEFDRAEALLRKVLHIDECHARAHFYLALLLADSGNPQGAADRLLQALSLEPTHVPSMLILGGLLMEHVDEEAGERAFRHVLALVPDHLLAWYSLLEIMREEGRGREGLAELSAAVAKLSEPVPLKHLRALFGGDVPPCAPRPFIASFYDSFVDMFEPWVIAGSDAPHIAQFVKELRSLPEMKGRTHVSLLDLGCNTGIIARHLSDIAAITVGVDISPNMLRIARRSKRYDVLYELDALDYVQGSETIFDVVVAPGALRWTGNLQPFFFAVRGVMHKESILAFMLDKEHSTLAYSVANHGRYSHHMSYVCDVAAAEGLQLMRHKEWMWEEEGDKMTRHIFFFKKTTIH